MYELKRRAKKILLMLDNDAAGMRQTEKYLKLYPWLTPLFLAGAKDKTDLCKAVGFDQAENAIKKLIIT
jgi:DNA primase